MRLRDVLRAATVQRVLNRDEIATKAQLTRSQQDTGRLSHRLERVRVALLRLKDRDYGNCAACGKPLSAARLRLLPSVGTCAACQKSLDAQAQADGHARSGVDEDH